MSDESMMHKMIRRQRSGIVLGDVFYFKQPPLNELDAYIKQRVGFLQLWIDDQFYELEKELGISR